MNPDRLAVLFKQQRFEEIVSQASADPSMISENPSLSLVVAASYLGVDNPEAAYRTLVQVEAVMADHASYLSLRGVACRRLGRHEEALTLLEEAISLSPNAKEYRNNYANLLIDLRRYREAQKILHALVVAFPDYEDAATNLKLVQSYLNRPQPLLPSATEPKVAEVKLAFSASLSGDTPILGADPLALAFSDDEVEANRQKYRSSRKLHPAQIRRLSAKIPSPSKNSIVDDLVTLSGHLVAEDSFHVALEICAQANLLLDVPQPKVYIAASDAYLKLHGFKEAERSILHAHHIGAPTHNTTVNLFSLALMRRDYVLATHYLGLLSELRPDSGVLPSLRNQLQVAMAKGSSDPFPVVGLVTVDTGTNPDGKK